MVSRARRYRMWLAARIASNKSTRARRRAINTVMWKSNRRGFIAGLKAAQRRRRN